MRTEAVNRSDKLPFYSDQNPRERELVSRVKLIVSNGIFILLQIFQQYDVDNRENNLKEKSNLEVRNSL